MQDRSSNGTAVVSQIVRWLSVIGALNWGLVGLFNWDLVRALLGNDPSTNASAASRAVYALVGVAGLGLALLSPRARRESMAPRIPASEGAR